MSSVAEQILARVETALIAANVAGGRIHRHNEAPFGDDELSAINIRRGGVETTVLGEKLERSLMVFELVHYVADNDWETAADALHMVSHAVVATDAPLAALGRGLRCVGTEPDGDDGEFVAGKLVARYQIQFLTRPGDLTRAIN